MSRRLLSKGVKEHPKLIIGKPTLIDPTSQGDHDNLQDIYRPTSPTTTSPPVASPLSPYGLQLLFSPQATNSDSSQRSRSAESKALSPLALGSHPVTPLVAKSSDRNFADQDFVDRFKELPPIPQSNQTEYNCQNENTVTARGEATSYYPDDAIPTSLGEFVNPQPQSSEHRPAEYGLGLSTPSAEFQHQRNPYPENVVQPSNETGRPNSAKSRLSFSHNSEEFRISQVQNVPQEADLDNGKEIYRAASLRQETSSNYSKRKTNPTMNWNHHGVDNDAPRKRNLGLKEGILITIVAFLLASTVTGAIYSFVKISQLESGSPTAIVSVTHITDIMTIVKTETDTLLTMSPRLSSTPLFRSTPISHTSSLTTKSSTSMKTSSSSVHLTYGARRRNTWISSPTQYVSNAVPGPEPTEMLSTLVSRIEERILATPAISRGERRFQIPFFVTLLWAIFISVGCLFAFSVCGTIVYEYYKHRDILRNPDQYIKDKLEQAVNDTLHKIDEVVHNATNVVLKPVKVTINEFASILKSIPLVGSKLKIEPLKIDKRGQREPIWLDDIVVTMTPRDDADPTGSEDKKSTPTTAIFPEMPSSPFENRGVNSEPDKTSGAGRGFSLPFPGKVFRRSPPLRDVPLVRKEAQGFIRDGQMMGWEVIATEITPRSPTRAIENVPSTTTAGGLPKASSISLSRAVAIPLCPACATWVHGPSSRRNVARRRLSLPFQFPWELYRKRQTVQNKPVGQRDALKEAIITSTTNSHPKATTYLDYLGDRKKSERGEKGTIFEHESAAARRFNVPFSWNIIRVMRRRSQEKVLVQRDAPHVEKTEEVMTMTTTKTATIHAPWLPMTSLASTNAAVAQHKLLRGRGYLPRQVPYDTFLQAYNALRTFGNNLCASVQPAPCTTMVTIGNDPLNKQYLRLTRATYSLLCEFGVDRFKPATQFSAAFDLFSLTEFGNDYCMITEPLAVGDVYQMEQLAQDVYDLRKQFCNGLKPYVDNPLNAGVQTCSTSVTSTSSLVIPTAIDSSSTADTTFPWPSGSGNPEITTSATLGTRELEKAKGH
ncbi:hypothetical protein K505DRAFT_24683 [Melanomma pulvis-pyrius CBS 109.77]|uniref:Uncharacterized protein n=1 Tax=Melanomma pulvis-pyrius CBS 109.77 TaxID=1314802 RepID=A0A6A6XDQ3_9PLEO|nr:hypothetical protein K505DRAFT_24683 [Melanomma pulvis-pyrius CBS 109.77]